MKKLFIMLTLVAFATGFTGCGKDDDKPANVFTAKIDGKSYKAKQIIAAIDGDEIIVSAYDDGIDNGINIIVSFDMDDVEEGETYDLHELSDIEIFYVSGDDDDDDYGYYWGPIGGEMKIIKLSDTKFEATFWFDAKQEGGEEEEAEVSDGVIKVTLKKEDF